MSFSLFRTCDVVCFDMDSTLIREEGIDVLAAHCGVGDQVSQWTNTAMNGTISFEEALEKRLALIKPTEMQLKEISLHQIHLNEGVKELIEMLKKLGKIVYVVSGGFRQMMEPVLNELKIPKENVFANTLLFNDNGEFDGHDKSEPTCKSGGKAVALQTIRDDVENRLGRKICMVMIGDGVTDMEAKPPADMFIGYGGVVAREKVKLGADLFLVSFEPLINALL